MSDPAPAPSPLESPFCPLPAQGGSGTVFVCTLCGCRFTHGEQVCGSCPMSTGCELVKCPHCGFQFPRGSRIADRLSRLWKSWRASRRRP